MAPTHLSVHSSTLVTAGIYLLIRYVNLLDFKYKNFILLISRLTILFAKKVVAYSTILRQLGFNKNVINSCW